MMIEFSEKEYELYYKKPDRRIMEYILKTYPEARENFNIFLDVAVTKFYYGYEKMRKVHQITTWSRLYQQIQNTEKMYEPSKEARKMRNNKRAEVEKNI